MTFQIVELDNESISKSKSTQNTKLAYSLASAAEALDLSLSTVKELVRTGELASVRIGRRVLISKAELERFLALREEESRLTERAKQQIEMRIADLNKLLDGLNLKTA